MDGNLSKALWIGVSILLFIAVVTIGLSIFGGMKDVAAAGNERIGSVAQGMLESEFSKFNGKEVTGGDVLAALDYYTDRSGEIIIFVAPLGKNSGRSTNLNPDTNTGLSLSSYNAYISSTTGSLSVSDRNIILSGGSGNLLSTVSKSVQDAARRDAENPNLPSLYINPSGNFRAHLIYDTNQVIRGIIFAQLE